MFGMRRRRKHFQGKASYIGSVLALGMTAFWPMNETAGTTAEELIANMDGSYSGATLAQATFPLIGYDVPSFDGVNDFLNIYSAALATAFRFTQGFISIWIQNNNPSEAGTTRYILRINRDASNTIEIFKTSTANQYFFRFTAGGTIKTCVLTISDTSPFHLLVEWADAANGSYVRVYKNNVLIFSETTGIGTVSGSGLLSSGVVVGASNSSASLPFGGKIGALAYKALAASTTDERKRLSGGQ